MPTLPDNWKNALGEEVVDPLNQVLAFVAGERLNYKVFPPEDRVFAAFASTPFDSVRVVILGQDPYHDDGQAHGLAFSVPDGVKNPPSLRNIYKELTSELNIPTPGSGDLSAWTRRGVLLLNTVLTVRAHAAASHAGHGWETFTDLVIEKLAQRGGVVFVLWGGYAQKKTPLIDPVNNRILAMAHPSPLSAHRGFLGGRPFGKINALLAELGQSPVDWRLSSEPELF